MKILHVISDLEIGGAQRLLSDLLPLMAKNHEISLLVNVVAENDFSKKIKEAGITILTIGCENIHSPSNILRIAQISRGFDIVHVHLFPIVYWAAFASLITPMRLIYTEHSTSNRRRNKWYFRPIEKFVYSRYKKIISISLQVQEALIEWLNASPSDNRFEVINNGVNLFSFRNIKKERGYSHTLIMVSRFVASKDQMTVIRCMKLLPDSFHVIFVGDGENLEYCKMLASSEGVSERVHFEGQQSDVLAWIAKADIGIQSSNWEGFGLTAVELMAAGIPIVATDVEGLKQVVSGAGLLFPVGDEKRLAEIILDLVSSREKYKLISSRCLERAKIYDINQMAFSYMAVYDELYT